MLSLFIVIASECIIFIVWWEIIQGLYSRRGHLSTVYFHRTMLPWQVYTFRTVISIFHSVSWWFCRMHSLFSGSDCSFPVSRSKKSIPALIFLQKMAYFHKAQRLFPVSHPVSADIRLWRRKLYGYPFGYSVCLFLVKAFLFLPFWSPGCAKWHTHFCLSRYYA